MTTNVVEQVECDLVGESQQPSKRRKKGGNTERDDELKAMVAAVLEDNKRLSQQIERMESNIQTKVLTQAVSTSGPATHSKPYYNRPYNNKYQGKPREPKDTPGTDGSLDLNLKCPIVVIMATITTFVHTLRLGMSTELLRPQKLLSRQTNSPGPKGLRPGANLNGSPKV